MGQTITNFDGLLKEFYEGALRNQLNNEIKLFDNLNRSGKSWSGRSVIWPAHLSRNTGVGAVSESGVLPTAGKQTGVASTVTASYNYGRINISGPVMAAGKNAFAEALAFELEGIKDDLAVDLGRQSYGEGLGILAQAGVDSHSSSLSYWFNYFYEPGQPGARYVSVGQGVSYGSAAGVSANGTAAIISIVTSIVSACNTDTITTSATALDISACNIFMFNHPGAAAGGDGIEMKGLRALIDDVTAGNTYGRTSGMYTASVQGISRTTYAKWNGTVIGNSQVERSIDSSLMQKAFDAVKKGNGKDVNKIIGEYSVVSAFLDAVSGDRRYMTKNFDAGHSNLSYNGIDIVQDLLAPYNELFLMSKEAVQSYVLKDFSFADDDGSILKNVSGYDLWEGFIQYFGNIGVEYPKSTCVIRDIKTLR